MLLTPQPRLRRARTGNVEPVTDSALDGTQSADDAAPTPDLDAIEADLDGVQSALGRLADGTYWTDEVTGESISAATLDADPLARRV